MLASEMLLVALLACLSTIVLKSVWQRSLQRKLPPGPTPLPFIGNYLQLDINQMYNCLMKMSEHYGPVFTIYLGTRRVVVLCGYDTVKEALVDKAEEFSGRGHQGTFDCLFKGYGVAIGNGERGKLLRRFSITTLRDFGVGKRGIEERIQEEAGFLIEALRGTHGTFIDITFFLSKTVANVISSIVFGDRFDYEDKELLSLLQMMGRINKFAASSSGQVTYSSFALPGPYHNLPNAPTPGKSFPKLPYSSIQGPPKPAHAPGQLHSGTRAQDSCPISSLQGHLAISTDTPTTPPAGKINASTRLSPGQVFPSQCS